MLLKGTKLRNKYFKNLLEIGTRHSQTELSVSMNSISIIWYYS